MSRPPRSPERWSDLFFDVESNLISDAESSRLDSYPEYDLQKTKKLLQSCKEETMLNSRGWSKCIGEKQQLKYRFQDLANDRRKLMKDYEELEKHEGKLTECYDDVLFKNGDLYVEIEELCKENNELQSKFQEAEGQAIILSEEKRILKEEMKSLQRQLCRRTRQQ
ncbi:uncharacterized protein [Typha latifolia]|uniref:uncharacterized protein n=1 Tax=Typha latifolia TaxID=4733 RepID=UPI003C2AF9E5